MTVITPERNPKYKEPRFALPLSEEQQSAYYTLLGLSGNDFLAVEAHLANLAEVGNEQLTNSTIIRTYLSFIHNLESTDQSLEDIDRNFINYLPEIINEKNISLDILRRKMAVAKFLHDSIERRRQNRDNGEPQVEGAVFVDNEISKIKKHQQDYGSISVEVEVLQEEINSLSRLLNNQEQQID